MTARERRRNDEEQGAVAIMVAAMVLVLFSVAALAVDLGHAFVQKQSIQKRADFAALAGALKDDLPVTATGAACAYGTAGKATDQAIIDVAAYLSDLQDNDPSTPATGVVSASELVDCNLANGEAGFGTFGPCGTQTCLTANPNQLTVVSQPRRVDFGLAQVMGFENVDVRGQATVEIKTPLQRTLPLYAHSGCDYGSQTISQPTNGQSSDGVTLAFPSDANSYIEETSLAVSPASTTTPPTVQMNSTTATVTITGTRLDKVAQIGFFRSGSPAPAPVTISRQSLLNPNGFTSTTTSLTVTLPTTVTGIQDVWFTRLYGPSSNAPLAANKWTPVENPGNSDKNTNLAALPFTVGSATLSCAQGSNDGNFGTLNLFNSSAGAPNGQDDNIAYNIAYGLQYGLAPYPKAKWTPPSYECVNGQDGVGKTWAQEGTNCVSTQPGLPSNAAQKGLVTGIGSANKAVLKDPDSEELCPFDHPTGTTHKTVAPTGQTISNDVLSCYFLNDSVTVGAVSSQAYAGDAVIDQSIYLSARFVNVPVLGRQPSQGSSTNYQIVDFRPGFITDQPSTATRLTGAPTTANGLTWSGSNQLMAVNVVFLNPKALPDPPLDADGAYIPYTGSGRKVALLVN